MESGVNDNPFNMKSDPQFRRVVLACILAMRRSRKAGVGVVRKQVHFVPPSFHWAGRGGAGRGWAVLFESCFYALLLCNNLCSVQAKVVSMRTEEQILEDISMCKTSSRTLSRRAGFYCIYRFSMRGG
jgi:hypothetical protein